jgi:hypothetical protein
MIDSGMLAPTYPLEVRCSQSPRPLLGLGSVREHAIDLQSVPEEQSQSHACQKGQRPPCTLIKIRFRMSVVTAWQHARRVGLRTSVIGLGAREIRFTLDEIRQQLTIARVVRIREVIDTDVVGKSGSCTTLKGSSTCLALLIRNLKPTL